MRTKRVCGAWWILLLFALSGASGLGYQMVWVRQLAAGLGHETPAMLGVAAAFLGGLAVGAWFLDRRVACAVNPARWYATLELIIGAFGAISAILIPMVNHVALRLAGATPAPWQQWAIVFILPFLALLPATAAMGATLPAMERFLRGHTSDGRCIGALYAANTVGAVLGTLGSVFVLMPALGFRMSAVVLAGVNFLCGGLVIALFREPTSGAAMPGKTKRGPVTGVGPLQPDRSFPRRRLLVTLVATGFLGIGYEFAVVRVLSQVLENTVYTFAMALAVYLVGTSAGAGLYQRYAREIGFVPTLNRLLSGLAAACGVSVGLLHFAQPLYLQARNWLGDSLSAAVMAEGVTAAVGFLLPTMFMGATFSHLVQASNGKDVGVGRAVAMNTLGCALAAFVSVVAMPGLGTKWTLLLLASAYLFLVPNLRGVGCWVAIPAGAIGLASMAQLQIVDRPPGAEVAGFKEGAMASVAVVRTEDGHRSLRVNNRLQMGGTAAALAERREAHLPLLLHPGPARALFLGPGTGITLGAAGVYPGLAVDGVELVPEVIEMMPFFEPENEGPLPKAGGRLLAADARRFVRTTTNRYDVIVADLFHPAHDGAGFLYTREHFQAVRERLAPGGLFCQWLPLHQIDEPVLRSVIRTFLKTFSETHAFLLHFNVDIPALALVGTLDRPAFFSPGTFERRLSEGEVRSRLRGVGLERFLNVAGCFVAGPEALKRFAGDAAVSTDDHPVVLFGAPAFAVRREVPSHALLLSFLDRCRGDEKTLALEGWGRPDDPLVHELANYIAARDIYLEGLAEEEKGDLSAAFDSYLESARRSLPFTPGYARCVTVIQLLARADVERARAMFKRLEEAQPAQPLGRKLLGPLLDGQAPP